LLKNNFTKKHTGFLGYKPQQAAIHHNFGAINPTGVAAAHFYGKAGRFGYMSQSASSGPKANRES